MIFCLETVNEYNSEFELVTSLMQHCDALKANGDWFRGKCFTCYSDYGTKYKVQFKYDGGKFTSVEVRREKMLIPNFVFPFMLTAPDFKKFFRCREDMIKFLMERGDGIEYELTTTSETMLNNKGVLTPFDIKYTAADNSLIVDGKKYQLSNE